MHKGLCIALGALIGAMLRFPRQASEAAIDALDLWAGHVLPALFPMLVCMLLFTSRMPKKPWLSLILGWLSGSPGGAKLCAGMDQDRQLQRRLAALSGTMSPMFLLSALPGYLGKASIGPKLLFCHLAGAVLTGFILHPGVIPLNGTGKKPTPLSLGEAILDSARAMITVCGCICMGTVACRMMTEIFPGMPKGVSILFQCLIEVTGGLNTLGQCALPENVKALLSVMAASFGGLSILMQNAAFWKKGGVGGLMLCFYRICHSVLSGLIYTAVFF